MEGKCLGRFTSETRLLIAQRSDPCLNSSLAEIAKRNGLSHNTVRKYLRSDTVQPQFKVSEWPSKIDPFVERLTAWLKREMGRSCKQKRTIEQLRADL
jgi:transcriptional regulator with XRE-family HTH domain